MDSAIAPDRHSAAAERVHPSPSFVLVLVAKATCRPSRVRVNHVLPPASLPTRDSEIMPVIQCLRLGRGRARAGGIAV